MFEYFTLQENEKFVYFAVPQILFTDDKFKDLSCDAKLLYSFLLNRTGLSRKNEWYDRDTGRVFVYYQQAEACEMLHVGKDKARRLFTELEDIGLIVRKKQGLGKPIKIYVKNFVSAGSSAQHDSDPETENQTAEKPVSRPLKNRCPDSEKIGVSSIEKSLSRNMMDQSLSIYPDSQPTETPQTDEKERMDEKENSTSVYAQTREKIRIQVEAEQLGAAGDELVQLMAWAATTEQAQILIHGIRHDTETVRKRFQLLTREHLQYVLDCLHETKTAIRSRRNYLLTCLYDAPDAYAASHPAKNYNHGDVAVRPNPRAEPRYVSENAAAYRSFIYNIALEDDDGGVYEN